MADNKKPDLDPLAYGTSEAALAALQELTRGGDYYPGVENVTDFLATKFAPPNQAGELVFSTINITHTGFEPHGEILKLVTDEKERQKKLGFVDIKEDKKLRVFTGDYQFFNENEEVSIAHQYTVIMNEKNEVVGRLAAFTDDTVSEKAPNLMGVKYVAGKMEFDAQNMADKGGLIYTVSTEQKGDKTILHSYALDPIKVHITKSADIEKPNASLIKEGKIAIECKYPMQPLNPKYEKAFLKGVLKASRFQPHKEALVSDNISPAGAMPEDHGKMSVASTPAQERPETPSPTLVI